MLVDEAVLRDPGRLLAVERARRVAPNLPMPLDAIARLAARLLGAPMGVVTFVGADEEHFAGAYGMPPGLAGSRQAPAAYSVCKYMVSADHPVSCDDMSVDEDGQLRVHPLVTEFGMRAFLGVPLRDGNDQPVGSVSVLDTAARHWSDEKVTTLVGIANLLGPIPVHAPGITTQVAGLDTGALLEAVQEAFIAVDANGVVVGWNSAAGELLGFDADEVCGRRLQDTVLPDYDGRPIDQALARLFAAPAAPRVSRHVVLCHRDGRRIPVSVALSVIQGAQGSLACAFVTDVSAQLDAEEDAERQSGFLSALLDSLSVGVVGCDADGRVVLVNRAMRRVQGLPETGELSPTHLAAGVAMLHHADGLPIARGQTPLMRAWRGESVRDVDVVIRVPGRRQRTFATNAQPITTVDGRRLGAVLAAHEVTAMRRAERFRDCHNRVRAVMSGATSAAEIAEPVLEAVATTLGWPHAELWLTDELTDNLHEVGRWTAAGLQIDDLVGGPVVKGVGITGTVWATNRPLWVPDITDTPHLATEESLSRAEACARRGLRTVLAVPVRDGDSMCGVLACYADAAEYHEELLTVLLDGVAAQIGEFVALQRARELTRQLTRAKDDLIALVGHEMRTPLTSIAAYIAMLAEDATALANDQRLMVAAIERNTANMRSIIDALLDLAGLESGHVQLIIGELDTADLIAAAATAAGAAAAERHVRIHTDLPPQLVMDGDARRLSQVAEHLLDNAIAFSTEGGEVHVRLTERNGLAQLQITDNGIGIPAGESDRLFDRFYRAANVRHQNIAGHGLGLSLVRTIVELHGGTVTLTPRQPTGTTVQVRLPLHRSAAF